MKACERYGPSRKAVVETAIDPALYDARLNAYLCTVSADSLPELVGNMVCLHSHDDSTAMFMSVTPGPDNRNTMLFVSQEVVKRLSSALAVQDPTVLTKLYYLLLDFEATSVVAHQLLDSLFYAMIRLGGRWSIGSLQHTIEESGAHWTTSPSRRYNGAASTAYPNDSAYDPLLGYSKTRWASNDLSNPYPCRLLQNRWISLLQICAPELVKRVTTKCIIQTRGCKVAYNRRSSNKRGRRSKEGQAQTISDVIVLLLPISDTSVPIRLSLSYCSSFRKALVSLKTITQYRFVHLTIGRSASAVSCIPDGARECRNLVLDPLDVRLAIGPVSTAKSTIRACWKGRPAVPRWPDRRIFPLLRTFVHLPPQTAPRPRSVHATERCREASVDDVYGHVWGRPCGRRQD